MSLQEKSLTSVLVFTNTKHRANRVAELLTRAGIAAMAIHGNKSQNARVPGLAQPKGGTIRVLVATDIAARGIDVSGLPCVINYELPNVPETYVHRIGRTGRAGKPGLAISFCNPDERAWLRDIEKLIRKTIPVEKHHPPVGGEAQSTEKSVKNGLCEATPKAVTRLAARRAADRPKAEAGSPCPCPTPGAFRAAPSAAPGLALRPLIPGRVRPQRRTPEQKKAKSTSCREVSRAG